MKKCTPNFNTDDNIDENTFFHKQIVSCLSFHYYCVTPIPKREWVLLPNRAKFTHVQHNRALAKLENFCRLTQEYRRTRRCY